MDGADDDLPCGAAAGTNSDSAHARLERLYRDEAPRLRRRLQARVRSRDEANDLLQDAFARLLRSASATAIRAPEALLNRIVRNLLIDRGRRLAARPVTLPIEAASEPAMRAEQADAIELEQMRRRYRAAVAALPNRMRQIFVLHRIDGLTYKDIAVRLDISVRTVEWHFGKAILRIGKELDSE